MLQSTAIKLPGYSITAAKGSRVYRCQLGTCNADDALNPVALVVAKPDGTLGVKNMTQNILNALTPSGKSKQIQPQEVIPLIQFLLVNIKFNIHRIKHSFRKICILIGIITYFFGSV